MPGTYAPPAVDDPNTRQIVGMRSADRRVRVHEVRDLGYALVEPRARGLELRLQRGRSVLQPTPFGVVRLALGRRQLALARLLVLVALPVQLVQLRLERGHFFVGRHRRVDVDARAAPAAALEDLVAALAECAGVQHGRES